MVLLKQLIEDGLYVFPLRRNGKTPLVEHWKEESSNDPGQIERWRKQFPRCNWAIDTGKSGITVVDVDVTKGKKGYASLDEVLTEAEQDTFSVETWSGGLHLYYDSIAATSAGKLGEGLDTRGVGGYVVAPGSVIEGKEYRVVKDTDYGKLPSSVLRALDKKADVKTASVDIELDNPIAVSRAISYLAGTPDIAIEGEQGDDTTYRTVCRVRDFGITPEVCLQLVATYYNPRCVPPWDTDELETKVRNAYKYAENESGCLDLSSIFRPVINESFDFTRASDLDFGEIPKREWIMWGRYVRTIVTVTVAEGGAGKSTLTLLEMISIAIGRDLTGHHVVEPSRVLYFNNEDDVFELNRRVAAAAIHHGIASNELNNLYLKSGRDFESGEEKFVLVRRDRNQRAKVDQAAVNTLVDFIESNKIGVVCIDPFVDLHECNENDNVEMNLVTKTLAEIAYKTKCAISIVHHVNKPSGGRGGWANSAAQSSRGASSVIDCARVSHALLTMPEEMAPRYGLPEEDHWMYVTLNSGKLNLSPKNTNLIWLKKVGVTIPNGEEVGTLELAELSERVVEPENEILFALRGVIKEGELVAIDRLCGRLLDSGGITFTENVTALRRKVIDLLSETLEDTNEGRIYSVEQALNRSTNRNCQHVRCTAITT